MANEPPSAFGPGWRTRFGNPSCCGCASSDAQVPVSSKAKDDGFAGYPDIIESSPVERRQKCTELSWLPQATISPSGLSTIDTKEPIHSSFWRSFPAKASKQVTRP